MTSLLAALASEIFIQVTCKNVLYNLIFIFLILIFSKRVYKLPFIFFSFILILRFYIGFDIEQFDEGRVVEINQSSVIIQNGVMKELVYNIDLNDVSLGDIISVNNIQDIDDEVHLFGFNINQWAQANHIIADAQYVKTIQKANPVLRFLSYENASNIEFQEWYRHILFQVRHDSVVGILFSIGILFSTLISFLEQILKSFKTKDIIIYCFIFLLLYVLGQPLSLIRILIFRIVRQVIPRKDHHFFFNFILLYLIEPIGLTQISWVLPLALSALSRFSFKAQKIIELGSILSMVFLSFSMRFSLIFIFLYQSLRKLFPFILLFVFAARCLPFLQNPFVSSMKLFNDSINHVKGFILINGHLSLLSLCAVICLFQLRIKNVYWLSIFVFIVFILNPITILPLFNQITMINVGQGDSFLFQSAFNQEVILLDTGNAYAFNDVIAAIDYFGLKEIDVMTITHADADHSANVDALMDLVNVKKIASYDEEIVFSDTSLIQINEMLYSNENDNSKVYYLNSEGIEFLFLADVSTLVEKQLIKTYPNLSVDVLKLGHHGSYTSTSLDLLHQVQASLALLSVGRNNYGHPSESVLESLSKYHLETLNSLEDGDSILRFYKGFLFVKTLKRSFYMTFAQ